MTRFALSLVAMLVSAPMALAQQAEPSEAQMQQAVEQWMRDVHSPWNEFAESCSGSPVERRSLPPDICAKICASNASSCLVPGEIRNFRKGSCLPATAGKIPCSFTADFIKVSPPVKEAGLPSEGLFEISNGAWRFSKTP
jgi:hypothetical protein